MIFFRRQLSRSRVPSRKALESKNSIIIEKPVTTASTHIKAKVANAVGLMSAKPALPATKISPKLGSSVISATKDGPNPLNKIIALSLTAPVLANSSTKTTAFTTKTTAPSTKTMSAPSTKTTTPSTKTTAPSTKTTAPSTKTTTPSTKTIAPSTKTTTPSTKTIAPSTKTTAPSTKTATPSAMVPATKPVVPATKPSASTTEPSLPSIKITLPLNKVISNPSIPTLKLTGLKGKSGVSPSKALHQSTLTKLVETLDAQQGSQKPSSPKPQVPQIPTLVYHPNISSSIKIPPTNDSSPAQTAEIPAEVNPVKPKQTCQPHKDKEVAKVQSPAKPSIATPLPGLFSF